MKETESIRKKEIQIRVEKRMMIIEEILLQGKRSFLRLKSIDIKISEEMRKILTAEYR